MTVDRDCDAVPSDSLSPDELEGLDQVARRFIAEFDAPALSVAICKQGQVIYRNAFGFSDLQDRTKVTTSHVFRIASLVKPITAAAIFKLIENRQLELQDTVFGRQGILGTEFGTAPYRVYVEDITVDHLLSHTCGGWQNEHCDPMFRFRRFNHFELISWVLDNVALPNRPGTKWAYSNFGYCVLGRVIEKVASCPYGDYIRLLLKELSLEEMLIAGNTRDEQARNEVTYHAKGQSDPYAINVKRMDSHGGLLATPELLVRFVAHLEGSAQPNILSLRSVQTMTHPTELNAKYSRGWNINGCGDWWHAGTLPGTTGLLFRSSAGYSVAALTNFSGQSTLEGSLSRMVWDMLHSLKSWES